MAVHRARPARSGVPCPRQRPEECGARRDGRARDRRRATHRRLLESARTQRTGVLRQPLRRHAPPCAAPVSQRRPRTPERRRQLRLPRTPRFAGEAAWLQNRAGGDNGVHRASPAGQESIHAHRGDGGRQASRGVCIDNGRRLVVQVRRRRDTASCRRASAALYAARLLEPRRGVLAQHQRQDRPLVAEEQGARRHARKLPSADRPRAGSRERGCRTDRGGHREHRRRPHRRPRTLLAAAHAHTRRHRACRLPRHHRRHLHPPHHTPHRGITPPAHLILGKRPGSAPRPPRHGVHLRTSAFRILRAGLLALRRQV